jgi:hypothetical protein
VIYLTLLKVWPFEFIVALLFEKKMTVLIFNLVLNPYLNTEAGQLHPFYNT